jgi:hypothetical protein
MLKNKIIGNNTQQQQAKNKCVPMFCWPQMQNLKETPMEADISYVSLCIIDNTTTCTQPILPQTVLIP